MYINGKTYSGIKQSKFCDKDIQAKYEGDVENWEFDDLGINKISRWSKIRFVKYANFTSPVNYIINFLYTNSK